MSEANFPPELPLPIISADFKFGSWNPDPEKMKKMWEDSVNHQVSGESLHSFGDLVEASILGPYQTIEFIFVPEIENRRANGVF